MEWEQRRAGPYVLLDGDHLKSRHIARAHLVHLSGVVELLEQRGEFRVDLLDRILVQPDHERRRVVAGFAPTAYPEDQPFLRHGLERGRKLFLAQARPLGDLRSRLRHRHEQRRHPRLLLREQSPQYLNLHPRLRLRKPDRELVKKLPELDIRCFVHDYAFRAIIVQRIR